MKKISTISKRELEQLYSVKRLSITKIAKIYACDPVTIFNRLKEYQINIRNKSDRHIWFPKHDFDGDLIIKAYIIGFRLGDLHVRKFEKNGKILNISCSSSNKNQIKLIEKLFSKYCKVSIGKPDHREIVRIDANVNESFNFLLERKKHIDKEIMTNRKAFFSFLAGYTDAEGSIRIHKQGFSTFRLRTYDKTILSDIKRQLELYGYTNISLKLTSKKSEKQNKDYWGISIYKKSQLLKFYKEIIPFIKHKDKKKDILDGMKNIKLRNKKYNHLRM